MAVNKGDIKTSANYDVKAQKPLDARAVRPTKADLIKKDSWSYDGGTVYAYEGMQVYVQDEKKTYYLKDLSKMFASDFSGWELMGTGATPDIDLSGYATKADLEKKENTITDLEQIRSGASKGATALQKVPDGYVTTEDLESALSKKQDADELAKVATSGNYGDLSGKPTFATVNGKRIDQGGNIQIEGGGAVADRYPIEYNDEFNDDFTI